MKKLIGYGYTNSSGVATMTKNASGGNVSGYTGTGAGVMNFRAEMHDDSTVVSPPYPVIDALFYDSAIKDDAQLNNNWNNNQGATFTRDTDGSTFSHNSYATLFADNPDISSNYDWTAPFTVEVDLISETGQANNIQIYDLEHNTNASSTFSELGITGNNTLKMVCNGSSVKYYVDGVEKPNAQVTATFDKCRCGLIIGNSGTIKYKDFRIYPI